MNIGIFTDTYTPQVNGVVTSIETFRKEYEKRGHSVYIFAPNAPGAPKNESGVFRFASMHFPQNPDYRMSTMTSKKFRWHMIRDMKLDIIHTQDPFALGLYGVFIGKTHHIPLVHTYHTFYERYVHYLPVPHAVSVALAKRVSKDFCREHNLIIAPSTVFKTVLEGYGIMRPIEVIPTGINEKAFSELLPKNEIYGTFNIPSPKHFLMFAGRLGKEKNIDILLRTLKEVLKKFPETTLAIAGDGTERQNLERYAQKIGVLKNVRFIGFIKPQVLYSLMHAARAFVFASVTETQGLVAAEAMMAGTPVIAVDEMGLRDVLVGGKGGIPVKLAEKDFEVAITKLFIDEALWKKKSAEAKKRAREFSSGAMAEKMLARYEYLQRAKRYFL
jgi:glycosyltransferase involved in cell wall biosynthesis